MSEFKKPVKWTEEVDNYLREIYLKFHAGTVASMLSDKFHDEFTRNAILARASTLGLTHQKNFMEIPSCKFNEGVGCNAESYGCENCGWNPAEQRRRRHQSI